MSLFVGGFKHQNVGALQMTKLWTHPHAFEMFKGDIHRKTLTELYRDMIYIQDLYLPTNIRIN